MKIMDEKQNVLIKTERLKEKGEFLRIGLLNKNRIEIINSMGIRVFRIKNEELMDTKVFGKIRNAMV
jgi:hypothetical protein